MEIAMKKLLDKLENNPNMDIKNAVDEKLIE